MCLAEPFNPPTDQSRDILRVLVVEDEPDLLEAVSLALVEDGYAVDESLDGEQGLAKALMWPYDLVVLDIMLPKMDGLTVLRKLRRKKSTPVLFLTARDSLDDRLQGLDGGADDYLVKPFSVQELLARARAVIRRASGQASSVISINSVEINLAKKTVKVDGADVSLTAREFSLVELLVLSRGKVVSRTEIYDHIFDENEDSLSNLLDVHVSNIRKKLGADFIQTRRGLGYIVGD